MHELSMPKNTSSIQGKGTHHTRKYVDKIMYGEEMLSVAQADTLPSQL
jgi:hypothetical protein